jgi:hypothetical protein
MLDNFFATTFIDNILSTPGKVIILVTALSFFGLMFWQGGNHETRCWHDVTYPYC